MAEQDWLSEVHALVGREYGRVYAWDDVNPAMIRHWCDVMGVENPLYTDRAYAADTAYGTIAAPPAMLQSWCEPGYYGNRYPPGSTSENPYEVLKLIESRGYPAVVAVNSELAFDRYVTSGERLYYTTRLDSVGEEKTTALGVGFFVTLIMTYFSEKPDGDERVGQLLFRVFKFRPHNPQTAPDKAAPPKVRRPRPGVSDDTRFFWEGCTAGKLLVQRCLNCGTLRHPPGPVCIECHSFEWEAVECSGRGSLYSYVVMHYPEVPPFDYPNPIGLIELDEGIRLVAGLVGADRADLEIGRRVKVEFQTFDGDLTLPLFRPVADRGAGP